MPGATTTSVGREFIVQGNLAQRGFDNANLLMNLSPK